jgi:phosphatidylinositol alpha-1,6-mannosyltransferase
VVTISRYSQQKIVDLYGVNRSKVRIVPNGVDPQRFKPSVEDSGDFRKRVNGEGKQVVLFVGRLIPRKGLSFLVQAAKRVVKEVDRTLFVIVGDGPLKSSLVSEVKLANLENYFEFLGDISEAELPAAYACADVFAFPSIQEGQGIALLEAQASSKPVVAFNVSGVAEAVVNGQTGLLVKTDSNELAEGILKLLSDADLRLKMGAKGREHVLADFTWEICAQRMLGVYREAKELLEC